jgi:hypothetical protein
LRRCSTLDQRLWLDHGVVHHGAAYRHPCLRVLRPGPCSPTPAQPGTLGRWSLYVYCRVVRRRAAQHRVVRCRLIFCRLVVRRRPWLTCRQTPTWPGTHRRPRLACRPTPTWPGFRGDSCQCVVRQGVVRLHIVSQRRAKRCRLGRRAVRRLGDTGP